MHFRSFGSALVALSALSLAAVSAHAETRLLRFPDIHNDKVVFTYAGDLWTASSAGGTATRLTAHPGLEMFARFSPDGQWIAFTGQYDGDEQVYVVPAAGGVPRQLTFYPARGPLPPRWGYDNQVYGWTPDGKGIFFRSMRDGWDLTDTRIYVVPAAGGLAEPLPMPVSGVADLSPDGKKVVYSPLTRDFRTWKRYQGGWAQDLWIFDLATHDAKNITNHVRTDREPMWVGGKIFFASDRTGTLNLFSYDVATGKLDQLTRSTTWDVRWPSADAAGQIVYETNGTLAVLDTKSGANREIAITVPTDGVASRPSQIKVADNIETYSLSPKGERALFVARGDLFSTPIEKGVAVNLTRSSRAHDREAAWSPDGKTIAYISDASGEEEIWLIDPSGTVKPRQLTQGGKAQRFGLDWAPDGKRISFTDKDGSLFVVTVADGKITEIARDRFGNVGGYTWSPCSGHIAFAIRDVNTFGSLYIWSVEDGKVRRVTDELFNERNPAWDPKGRYLYYLSGRSYAPVFDGFDFTYALDRNDGIFALALRKDVENPFAPESDELAKEDEKKDDKAEDKKVDKKDDKKDAKKDAKDAAKKEEKPAYTKIDFDGLAGRAIRVPVDTDNYFGLVATEEHLLYVRAPTGFLGRAPKGTTELVLFTFKTRKETVLVADANGYGLSFDGKKILVREGEGFNLYEVSPGGKDGKKSVSTAGLVVDRVPAEEWAEVFDEVWRRYRDYFYVENMHGYDWEAIGKRYRALVPHVGHRSDLNYILGEMVAELSVSHAYVGGGDFDLPPRPRVALPGARFTLDKASGRHKIVKIFGGQNEEEIYRSPLTEVGVDVKVGDYVLAVDGVELSANDDPYRLLRGKAGQAFVRLTVNSKPSLEGSREVRFAPINAEINLIYLEWITANRERTAKLSDGRVGYIHIPDMGDEGMREFIKQYYAQIGKAGLIVDVRGNGGGFISASLLERLSRKLLGVDYARGSEEAFTYPTRLFHGHMACLISETSASDGDIFPYMFRQLGLGPLIGKRSWGGVVGISGGVPLIDGGDVAVPQFGSASPDGQWVIEGHGVDPDIEVDNDPKSVIAGRDPQLERGVEEILKKIKESPKTLPKRPADPVKTQ